MSCASSIYEISPQEHGIGHSSHPARGTFWLVSTMGMLNYDAVAKREFVAYPLDKTLYTLGEEEIAFFKSQTGIDDEEELKQHILRLQKEAYEV